MSSVQCLRKFVNERLTAATEEILTIFEKTITAYQEEISRQRRLLDVVLNPEMKLHNTAISQLLCNDEDVADLHLFNQKRITSLDEECAEPPRIKEEERDLCTSREEEQLALKQEEDWFKSRPTTLGRGHSEDQTVLLDPTPPTNIKVIVIKSESDREGSGASKANGDRRLSDYSLRPKSCERGHRENARTDQKPQKKHFECLFCREEFHDFLKLKIHMRTHTGKSCFKGDACGKGFTQKAPANKHMMTHTGAKPFRCRVCGKEFNCHSNCITHMKTHTGQKPHACVTCGKSFRRSADLRRHNRIHTGEKPYSCVHCGKEFSHHSSLTNHVRVHTGEKPYDCMWCGKAFAINTTLKIHTRVHTGEKPYTCSVCGRNFAHNTGLRLHRRIHAREKQQS